jgi:hypothetical protein
VDFSLNELSSYQAKDAMLANKAPTTELIGLLNEADLAECLLTAAWRGNLTLMRDLVEQRGAIAVRFENTRLNSHQYLLNGQPIQMDTTRQLSHIASSKQLKDLLTAVHQLGLQGLIDPGPTYPLLLRNIDRAIKPHAFNTVEFSGLLPELSQDRLSNPELALALAEEAAGPVTPDAFRPLLCWATKEMVHQFPEHLAPIKPFQNVGFGQSMKAFKASYDPEKPEAPLIISVGVNTTRRSMFAKYLFRLMAPEATQMGFDDEGRRVLCKTTTDFLLNFPTVNHTEDNHRAARAFVEHYCPFEIIASQAEIICARDFGHDTQNYSFKVDLYTQFSYGDSRFFEMLSLDHPLRERALNMMEWEQWQWLVQKFDGRSSNARGLIAVRDTFGLDNTGMKLILTQSKLAKLIEAGYRFSDQTSVFDNQGKFDYAGQQTYDPACKTTVLIRFDASDWRPPHADQLTERQVLDYVVEQYQGILATNLWPSVISKPSDIKMALAMMASYENGKLRFDTNIALRAYLKNAGIEACVKASDSEHWPRLIDVFSREAFENCYKTLPHKFRGLLLEEDMGL